MRAQKITQSAFRIFLFLICINSYGQVTSQIQSLQYTNSGEATVTVVNCGTIDLKKSTGTSVNFGVNLSKPTNLLVGNGTLKIFTKRSSGDFELEKYSVIIPANSWTGGNPSTNSVSITINLNPTDYNLTGGMLYAQFINESNVAYAASCNYTIKKDPIPTFNLTQTALSIPCGSTNSYNFHVQNIYNTPGVTYSWSAIGWKRNGVAVTTFTTTTNSVDLVPTLSPSNVSVTPIVDGVAQSKKTCVVTRSPIVQNATISGNTLLCNTGTYSVSGILTNQTVTWSLSNSTIASLNTTTVSSVILTKIGDGLVTLYATISNICGETYNKSLDLSAGMPSAPSLLSASGVPYNSFDLPMNCDTNTSWLIKFLILKKEPHNCNLFTGQQEVLVYMYIKRLINMDMLQ